MREDARDCESMHRRQESVFWWGWRPAGCLPADSRANVVKASTEPGLLCFVADFADELRHPISKIYIDTAILTLQRDLNLEAAATEPRVPLTAHFIADVLQIIAENRWIYSNSVFFCWLWRIYTDACVNLPQARLFVSAGKHEPFSWLPPVLLLKVSEGNSFWIITIPLKVQGCRTVRHLEVRRDYFLLYWATLQLVWYLKSYSPSQSTLHSQTSQKWDSSSSFWMFCCVWIKRQLQCGCSRVAGAVHIFFCR